MYINILYSFGGFDLNLTTTLYYIVLKYYIILYVTGSKNARP